MIWLMFSFRQFLYQKVDGLEMMDESVSFNPHNAPLPPPRLLCDRSSMLKYGAHDTLQPVTLFHN